MPSEKVLIVGAGVAGSILAFWLAKNDFQVVVIERSKAEQKAGQGIEIEEPALKVVKAMGIFDKLNATRTGETGFKLVNERDQTYATFEIGAGFSPTGALELMRGDFTEVLYKTADQFPNVSYRFETTIQGLTQTRDKVIVDMENRAGKTTTTEEFDLVIGADGVKSRTRHLAMGSPEKLNCFKLVGAFTAYFSIPREARDWPYSKLCQFPGRRTVWLRPTREDSKTTSVYLIHVGHENPKLHQAFVNNDRAKQKEGMAELFSGLGWETPRVVEEMLKSDNFYCDELTQIKLKKWSQDRVVLVGDSAWAPTVFTGQGNQLAIIGAWILAQELSRDRTSAAFEKYEARLRSYVEESQKIPLDGRAPYYLNPESAWSIFLLRNAFWLVSWIVYLISLLKLPALMPEKKVHDDIDLQME